MHYFLNYKILELIGEGGMAKVYLATHNTLGHQVAIKVLNKDYVFNSNIRSRFIEEAKKMVRMNHPNVVKVTDLIDDENTVAIVMEYVQGKTLKQILEDKKLNDKEIEIYFKQMVNALEYVHSQGLIHRDVKPSNFILSNDGHLKLSDFGISKSLDTESIENTQTGTTVSLGTPMYMSPEQIRSTKDVTYLTDVYSLGVVLWEMVTGKKPYEGNTLSTFDLQLKIVQEKLPLTNSKWDKTIQKATKKNERERFQNIEEIIEFLKDRDKSFFDNEKVIVFQENTITEKINIIKSKYENKKKTFNFIFITTLFGMILIFCIVFILKNDKNNFRKKINKQKNKIEKIKPNKNIDEIQNVNDSVKLIRDKNNSDFDVENEQNYNFKNIKIGSQIWSDVNLNVTNFRNGDEIFYCKNSKDWLDAIKNETPACIDNLKGSERCKIYNWYAVNDLRNLAPRGYKIPSFLDWKELLNFIGNESDIKEKRNIESNIEIPSVKGQLTSEKYGGLNMYKFNAIPSGRRNDDGRIDNGNCVDWWTSSMSDSKEPIMIGINYIKDNGGFFYCVLGSKTNGYSVRLIKE